MTTTKNSVTVQFSKNNGAPQAVIYVDPATTLEEMQGVLKGIFQDQTALKAVGLRFCGGCKSGLDINIRSRYEHMLELPGR